ncbi:hypothetical protein D3C75_734210 [compost metagenome]
MFPEKKEEAPESQPTEVQDAGAAEAPQEGEKTSITTSVVSVEILGFSDPLEGKIDTGAGQSSLHAEEIEVEGSSVTFVLNDRRYRTTVKSSQEVSSADGGQQSRPVIAVSLTIAGKNVPEVLINLNDRSGMPQQLLIGQDVIKAANLVIDISDEPADSGEGVVTGADGSIKPEQEEVPTGVQVRPEVSSSSIAQLGDNPMADSANADAAQAAEGEEVSLLGIKTQLQELLSQVEKLIQKQG